MPHQLSTGIHLKNISTYVAITANTLDVLVISLNISALKVIMNTTESLLEMVETVKQDKSDCTELMGQVDKLLNAIVGVYLNSDTVAELPPSILNQIIKFTDTTGKNPGTRKLCALNKADTVTQGLIAFNCNILPNHRVHRVWFKSPVVPVYNPQGIVSTVGRSTAGVLQMTGLYLLHPAQHGSLNGLNGGYEEA
ncbi:hypothetical protein B0H16DRAFT_1468702 [Mycena metata]|uniref:Uncharacterized protein n=1 Tax=Mycena metata TaxID=1033252 RepID=A0AAD7MV92_9AGAR|nr:hypothetical protein B0H16DRAFT_1468702 [Mycena metata]